MALACLLLLPAPHARHRSAHSALTMSAELPPDMASLKDLPPEILQDLLANELDEDADEAAELRLDELLSDVSSPDGAIELAQDLYLEDLALSMEAEDDADMPADFDTNAQSWLDYNFVADYGFDPFGLAFIDLHIGGAMDKDRPLQVILRDYREAELRHGRLAMLAALGWPVQELLSPILSRLLREPMLLAETGGRSPSVLNGGLEQSSIPLTLAAFAVLTAIIDIASLQRRKAVGEDWLPGDFGFDPLNLLGGASMEARRDMQEKEINNGRLAMIAVAIYVVEEAVTRRPLIELTPWLFKPIIAYPQVQQWFDQAFAVSAFRPELP